MYFMCLFVVLVWCAGPYHVYSAPSTQQPLRMLLALVDPQAERQTADRATNKSYKPERENTEGR